MISLTTQLEGYIAYVGNSTIAGNSQEEHDFNVQKFQEVTKRHDLTFNEKKSVISTDSNQSPGIHCLP